MARERAKETEPAGPEMTEQERAELDDRLARMLTPPQRSDMGGQFFLLWSQRDETGSARVMIWTPETPEEIRGANLFYDAAHGLGAFTRKVKAGKPVRRSTEETALINAIIRNRDDLTGYLVYADYLTEHGNSQGDCIRLCVELSRMKPGDPGYDEKNTRLNELVDAHAEEWYAPLGELGPRPDVFGTFSPWMWMSIERGVIEEVTIDRPGILPQNADRLFAAAPFLRKLEFQKGHLDAAGLAKVKQLAQIDTLDLSYSGLTTDRFRALLRAKHLTGLKTLNIAGNDIGDVGAEELAAWSGLAKLESLDVSRCALGIEGVRNLAVCKGLANLKRLRIGGNESGADGAALLFDSPHLGRLTELELGGTEFFPVIASSLDLAAFAKTLQTLDLESATFQPGAFEAFTLCKLPALRSLKLNSVNLLRPAVEQLAGAQFAATLEELYLDNCSLRATSAAFFYQGKFPKLRTLDISRNRIERYGLEMLASKAKSFPALTNLRLWDNRLTPPAITALAKSKLSANLTDLDLSGNKIGPAGALALANSKHLTKLTSLIVDEKTVGKKGKQALLDRFGESVVSFR